MLKVVNGIRGHEVGGKVGRWEGGKVSARPTKWESGKVWLGVAESRECGMGKSKSLAGRRSAVARRW